MSTDLGSESDHGTTQLVADLDVLAEVADAAARQSGLAYWIMNADGDVHCEGYEADPAWRVANVPDDVGNRHVAAHIAQNDPATVLAITEALRRVAAACAEVDAERSMAMVRSAVAQASSALASARAHRDETSPDDHPDAAR